MHGIVAINVDIFTQLYLIFVPFPSTHIFRAVKVKERKTASIYIA